MATLPSRFELSDLDAAAADFARRFPGFDPDGSFAVLRRTEYRRLDDSDQVYLDYTTTAMVQTAGRARCRASSIDPSKRSAPEFVSENCRIVRDSA